MGSRNQDPYPVLVYVTSQQESTLREVFSEHGWELVLHGCTLVRSLAKPKRLDGRASRKTNDKEKNVVSKSKADLSDDWSPKCSASTTKAKSELRKSERLTGKVRSYAEDDFIEAKGDVIVEVDEGTEEYVITDKKINTAGVKRSLKLKQNSKKVTPSKRQRSKTRSREGSSETGSGGYLVVKKEIVSEVSDEETDAADWSEVTLSDDGSETDSNTENIEETVKRRSELKTKSSLKIKKRKPTLQDTEKLTNSVLKRIGVIKDILGSLPGDECPTDLGTIFSQLIQMTEILSVALAQVDPAILNEYSGEVMHYVDPKAYKNISPVVQTVMANLLEGREDTGSSSTDSSVLPLADGSDNVMKEKFRIHAGNPRHDLYTHVCRLKHVLECLPCEDIPTQFYDMLFQYVEMADMVSTSVKHMKEKLENQKVTTPDVIEHVGAHGSEDVATSKGLSKETLEKIRQKSVLNADKVKSQQEIYQETSVYVDNLYPIENENRVLTGAAVDSGVIGMSPMIDPIVNKKPKKYKKRPRMACPYCSKSFSRRALCFRHIESFHPEQAVTHVCFTCHATFRSYSLLNRHKKVSGHAIREPPGPVICELCGKTLSKKAAYDVHMKSVHKDLYDVECDVCGKKFKSEITMKDHKNFVHAIETAICDFCGKSFANRKKMMCHRSRHVKERSHTCEDCGKSFFTKTLLSSHRMIHTGEKPHKCPHCPYATAFKNNLPKHIKIHNIYQPMHY